VRIELGPIPADVERWLPENEADASGIGVNYADAYLKAFKKTLDDGSKVSCKRRGLELTLKVGSRTGTALMRRLEHGPDVREILHQALVAAAADAGVVYSVENGQLYLKVE
jgi:hypothetical protein